MTILSAVHASVRPHSRPLRPSRRYLFALVLRSFATGQAIAIAGTASAQTFVPPASPPADFWNVAPVNVGTESLPNSPSDEAYLGIRMSGVSWSAIETSRGAYQWTGVQNYTKHGGSLLYTFLSVPAWANAQTLTITGFSSHSNILTFIAANQLIVTNVVVVSGIPDPYGYLNGTFAVTQQGPTQFSVASPVPKFPITPISGTASFAGTSYQSPLDLNVSTPCPGVGTGAPTTDCSYKQFVTALMLQNCPAGAASCVIRNFESWNEFNSNGYWDDSYKNLATMSEDAATIVRQFCSNCMFGAGSVNAGGAGWNDTETTIRSTLHPHWTYYDEALEAFLLDWSSSATPAPDFVSWHAYSARGSSGTDALTPQPMPEYVYSGDGSGSGGDAGSSLCSVANESRTANKYCVDSIVTQTGVIAALTSVSTYGVLGVPFWETEGGFSSMASMTNSSNNDANPVENPTCGGAFSPLCAANVIRSAYLARWLILLRASGAGRAYWYSWDDPCFGTLYGMTAGGAGTPGLTLVPCTGFNYGQTINSVLGVKTLAGTAWDQVQLWLNGASIPTGCTENVATHIYSCTITRTAPAGYSGLMVWYTTWMTDPTYSPPAYTPPPGYTQYRTLRGTAPTAYSTGTVTLTAEPILFEMQSANPH